MQAIRRAGIRVVCAVAAAAALGPTVLAATPDVRVDVRVAREVVVEGPDGSRTVERRPVDVARPGEVLVYSVRARNVGNGPALGARLDDPVPPGTVLLPDSVETAGADLHASLDGGDSWAPFPVLVERTAEDGTVRRVPAPPEAYTHLRWVLVEPLGPGQEKNVSFKVRIR
jgi:uncharacterized repeat protein (TIGR01451 family)